MPPIREKDFTIISDENSRHEMAISWVLDPDEIDPHTRKFSIATEASHICHRDEAVFRNLIHKRAQE
ncbi:hypothetical protein K3495_g10179 [Podosphaera aphanis]|nr:hypothetical protein K3495_g10179 [Podosphaera aphanis]